MLKRGQITVFIILGVLVFGTIIALVYFKSAIVQGELGAEETLVESGPTKEAIKSYVESCVKNTAKEGILENGYSGGYFTLPEQSTTNLFNNVPYYKVYEQDFSPSDEIIASELGKYVDALLDLCLDDFQPFIEQGYNITAGKLSSTVKLSPTKFSIETTLPLTVTLGTTITEISSFYTEVPAKEFYDDLATAKEIANSVKGEMICMSCFSDLAEDNDLFVGTYAISNNTYLFEITDNNVVSNKNFRLRFAVKYNESVE